MGDPPFASLSTAPHPARTGLLLQAAVLALVVLLIVSVVTVALLWLAWFDSSSGGSTASYPAGTLLVLKAGGVHELGPGEGSGGGPYSVSVASNFSGTFTASGGNGIDGFLLNSSDWSWSSRWSPPVFSPTHSIWSTLNASGGNFAVPVQSGAYYVEFISGGPAPCQVEWTAALGFFPVG